MMKKKRAITLLEVVISLGLLTLLLTTLFYWYGRLNHHKRHLQELKWPLMEERFAEQRLASILMASKQPFFTTADHSLVFLFDRGIWQDPLLSNTVLARLYHDPVHKRLCIGIWPAPQEGECLVKSPSQTLILLDQVSSVSMSFYSPPNFSQQPLLSNEVHPKGGWQYSWEGTYSTLPSMIQIQIGREASSSLESRTIDYYFDLPHPIHFPKEGVA